MRKDLTLEEFLEGSPQDKMNRYAAESLSETMQLNNDLSGLGVASSVEVSVEVCEDGSYRYEYSWVRLGHPSLALYIKWDDRIKRYLVSEDFTKHMENINTNTVKDVRSILTEPNKIGVLNPKKIGDWVKYYEDLYNQLKVIDDCNGLRKRAFLDSLDGLDVKWSYGSDKSGSIVKNGVEYSFSIGETYIHEKVELHYSVPNSLKSFLALSDNKYKNNHV
jgi:hypothetical protein